MSPNDLLVLARGPLFDISVAIFVIGVVIRLFEIVSLGRAPNYTEPRGTEFGPGMKAIFTKMLPDREKIAGSPVVTVAGYLFHIGLFIVILLFVPHIELIASTSGLSWPGLPTPVVDAASVITMLALVVLFVNRRVNKLLRFLSTTEDYFLLVVTFLAVLTGYVAFHRLINPYPLALAVHILSVELLLVVFPFTKLMHAFTLFLARWYTGASFGRRGVES